MARGRPKKNNNNVKKVEKVEKVEKQRRYCHFEKVEARKAQGWKVISLPDDRMAKIIRQGGGDLVLMEKE